MQRTPKAPKLPKGKIETEPGFDKRLGDMYKKVLHTPPKHVPDKRTTSRREGSKPK